MSARDYRDGWFKVSRRLFDSSRWHRGSGDAIKVLVFLVGKSQDPMNATPGEVQMGETAIAHGTGLSVEATVAALHWLCAPDPESRTRTDDGCTVRRLEDGSGYGLVNFEPYHPGDRERAEARTEKARHAALARWGRPKGGREAAADVQASVALAPAHHGGARSPDQDVAPSAAASLPRIHVTREETGQRVPMEQAFVAHEFIQTREKRRELETEALGLAHEVATARGLDPMEVFSEASSYTERDGTERRKTNVATMTPDRLLQTLTELRAVARVERAKSAGAPAAMDAKHEEALVIERIASRRRGYR